MKIMIGKKEGNISIPSEILKQAGLNSTDELELHISDGMVFMAKKQVSTNDPRIATNDPMLLGGESSERANEICIGCDSEDRPYMEDEFDKEESL